MFIVKALSINCLAADYKIAFAYSYCIKIVNFDFFCFDIIRENNIDIDWRVRSSQFVDIRSNIVRINFAKKNYINYNATVYRDFDVFALLYIEDIATISNIMLTCKRDKLSIIFYKVFFYFFSIRIKLE